MLILALMILPPPGEGVPPFGEPACLEPGTLPVFLSGVGAPLFSGGRLSCRLIRSSLSESPAARLRFCWASRRDFAPGLVVEPGVLNLVGRSSSVLVFVSWLPEPKYFWEPGETEMERPAAVA